MNRGDILLRGYENGQRVQQRIPCKPYLFVNSKFGNSEYRNLKGKPVDRIDFDSPADARDFVKRYADVSGFDIYGLTNYVYTFINDTYRGSIDYDPATISLVNIDIEVAADQGFPDIQIADKEITAITMKKNNLYIALGCGDFVNDNPNVKYLKCKDESELLLKFLDVWRSKAFSPDVVTGWNIEMFDIPYIVNRIKRVLGDNMAKKMSPWELLEEKVITIAGNDYQAYVPVGISTLDYLQCYRKFSFTMQESYKLDHICHIELGERKMDYSEYDSLFDLYKKNFQLFMEYNIRDVDLVGRLEDKLKLLEQIYAIAYDGKVNYQDAFTSVRMWDVIIHNYLLTQKIVVPQNKVSDKDRQIIGAFVKDPQVGMHKWVVSFDLNSLYPHLIMQYNISPETYVGQLPAVGGEDGVQKILDGYLDEPSIRNQLIEQNVTCAASGCMFDKDYQGFLPKLMQKMYDDRVIFKNKMIEAKKAYELDPSEENVKAIAQNHNMQLAKKIQLNSAYGALANAYFRWFDNKLAESITLSGQLSIKWMEREMNIYLNKLFKTEKEDYVIACDTDSMYITLDALVNQLAIEERPTAEIVKFLDHACESKLEPFIDRCYERLSGYVNAYDQKMKMKREAIADKGIWTAKKRYMLNVWNNEGVSYAEPKLKVMGIEAVRSSTPAACRSNIKKLISMIMTGTEDDVIKFIQDFRVEFSKLPFEDVAFPRGCRSLAQYSDRDTVYKKATPIHVRGALTYNHLLRQRKLDKRFPLINEGDKIKFCYMKVPNPTRENVFAVPSALPPQLALDQFIDFDLQFDKAFVEPIKTILDAINWRVEKKATLDDFWS
ncbi:PolB DNA polymerase elongation subunit (family B) [uncultured Caudovirales phage]|uniref:DNA polymerase n=1 Tax=uncultured Caudovirales phage TaxID=2100421 RepID=A0A6J7WUY6_9CAUD|nr:PolB DNA polymerase elongation subunit (family B) [uncultured Caudovirales phage]